MLSAPYCVARDLREQGAARVIKPLASHGCHCIPRRSEPHRITEYFSRLMQRIMFWMLLAPGVSRQDNGKLCAFFREKSKLLTAAGGVVTWQRGRIAVVVGQKMHREQKDCAPAAKSPRRVLEGFLSSPNALRLHQSSAPSWPRYSVSVDVDQSQGPPQSQCLIQSPRHPLLVLCQGPAHPE